MPADEDIPMGETKISFFMSDKILDEVRKFAFSRDKSASEVLRACVLVGFPTIQKMPALTRMVSEDLWIGDEKE